MNLPHTNLRDIRCICSVPPYFFLTVPNYKGQFPCVNSAPREGVYIDIPPRLQHHFRQRRLRNCLEPLGDTLGSLVLARA